MDLTKYKIRIEEPHEVSLARREIANFSKKIGFKEKEIEQISLAVTELGENLIKHETDKGVIKYFYFEEGLKSGIEIVSSDRGPGIADINVVIEDGFSSKNSLGIGLGAVKRMMSEFTIKNKSLNQNSRLIEEKKVGTKIITRKYLIPENVLASEFTKKTIFSVFSRGKLGELYNGDNYVLKHFNNFTLFSVIDGLGHGRGADLASIEARACILENYDKTLEEILNLVHNRLKKTRGAALSIGLIDFKKMIFKYAGIGNVLTRVYNSLEPIRPVNYNGTLGVALRTYKVMEYNWNVNNVIVMTSDGISTRYNLDDHPEFKYKHPMIIGNNIFKEFGKNHDDATILIGGPS